MSCLSASLLSASLAVPGKQVQWFTSLPHSSLLHHSCPIPGWFRPTRGCSYHRDSLLKFPTGGRTSSILIILVGFHAVGIPVTCSANSFFWRETQGKNTARWPPCHKLAVVRDTSRNRPNRDVFLPTGYTNLTKRIKVMITGWSQATKNMRIIFGSFGCRFCRVSVT